MEIARRIAVVILELIRVRGPTFWRAVFISVLASGAQAFDGES